MKVSLQWLKDYVPVGVAADVLAHRLTMAGLEVEGVSKKGADTVFELEVTPNRPDCLNVFGIAREVSALLNKPLKIPSGERVRIPSRKADITVKDKSGCPRYVGALIEGVRVKKAPASLSRRLESVGVSSISNIVDITNFCLMETGQPLHAFDHDKLEGGRIIVRRAKKGERIVTIDNVERELDPSILVIADARRPVAIAGIMGGKDTEVTEETKNILLESAYFDPVLIRRASRKLGLSSDSSYRFERGVDMTMVQGGAQRAAALILRHAKGRLTRYRDVKARTKAVKRTSIIVSKKQIEQALGSDLTASRCRTILKRLECKVASPVKNVFRVTPPSFRSDLKCEVDIVEEIARVVGYDNLPSSFPNINVAENIRPTSCRGHKRKVRGFLVSCGLNEIITYTMTNQQELDNAGLGALKGPRVQNALTRDQEMMRPTLLPSFLAVARANINREQKDLRLFEIGKVYQRSEEKETLGILLAGRSAWDWRRSDNPEQDFYDLKGVVERLFKEFVGRPATFVPRDRAHLAAGQAAEILVDGISVGEMGALSPDVLERSGIKQDPVYFAQLDLGEVFPFFCSVQEYTPVTEYPAVVHDVSLTVKEDVPYANIERIAYELGGNILSSVTFTELYLDPKKIPSGHRGMVISLRYESSQRTLREEEVLKVHERICQDLVDRLGVIRR